MHEGWCAPNETPVSVSTTPQATATMAGVSKARFQTNKYSTMPSERSSCVDESTMFDQNGKCDAANIQEASEQHLSGDNLANEDDFEIEYDQEPDVGVRTRKPYTITRARKSWTDEEHNGFLDALSRYELRDGVVGQTKKQITLRKPATHKEVLERPRRTSRRGRSVCSSNTFLYSCWTFLWLCQCSRFLHAFFWTCGSCNWVPLLNRHSHLSSNR